MELSEFQKTIKELVASDKIGEGLDLIIQFAQAKKQYTELENSAIINRGKLDRIDREKRDDLIQAEDYAIQRNQVSAALLAIVGDLKEVETTPSPIAVSPSNESDQVSQHEIQNLILSHDRIFIKIILGVLVVSAGFFVYFMILRDLELGGVFFSSSAATCYIYLNNQKRMLQSIQATM